MIDKARIEQWLKILDEFKHWSGTDPDANAQYMRLRGHYTELARFDTQIELLTDYLALREIVEALAARDPLIHLYTVSGKKYFCELCEGEPTPDRQGFVHEDGCPYALVGPASGARTEAGE